VSYSLPTDELYPRDEAHRLRVYARQGDDLRVLACCDVDSLGATLLQLDEDERERGERLVDLGAIGVLDAVEGRWLVLPWHRPEGRTTVGAPPLEVVG
jgi:hypothetical protein